MSTPMSSQQFDSYVPVYDEVPESWNDARAFLVEQLKKISNAVNVREIGWLLNEEVLSGQAFIPGVENPQEFRSVFRLVLDFGALPNASTKSVAHGINVTDRFTLVCLQAAATDPTGLQSLAIPYASTASTTIEMSMDDTNIIIKTQSDCSAYTRCYVVISYIQEL